MRVAGLATAFWLHRLGHRVTIVEVAGGLRRGGTPVDIEGETIATLERMGLIDAVRARALPRRAFAFKDADDVTLGSLRAGSPVDDGAGERYEIHRDDLLEHLGEKAAAARLMRAIERVTADPKLHTPDLGGRATTRQVTDAVIASIGGDNE